MDKKIQNIKKGMVLDVVSKEDFEKMKKIERKEPFIVKVTELDKVIPDSIKHKDYILVKDGEMIYPVYIGYTFDKVLPENEFRAGIKDKDGNIRFFNLIVLPVDSIMDKNKIVFVEDKNDNTDIKAEIFMSERDKNSINNITFENNPMGIIFQGKIKNKDLLR